MSVISMKQLLEAGVHFGHQTRRWNPKMAPYIFTERNGIHIIDLQKSVGKVDEAYRAVADIVSQGGTILFVGTKKQAQDAVKAEAERCGMFYVNERWLGGMLTNFKTIQSRIQRLKEIEAMEADGTFEVLPKKEVILLKKELEKLEFTEVRGMQGVKEASYNVAGMEVKLAVVSGTANAAKLLEEIKAGKANYHFIEVMACPGGCINGGGQPIHDAYTRANTDIKGLRAAALYTADEKETLRKSHNSPIVKEIYENYLGECGGHKAHHLLHTSYVPRKKN